MTFLYVSWHFKTIGIKLFFCLCVCRSLALAVVSSITPLTKLVESSIWCQNLRNFIAESWKAFGSYRKSVTPSTEHLCEPRSRCRKTKSIFFAEMRYELVVGVLTKVLGLVETLPTVYHMLGSVQGERHKRQIFRIFFAYFFFQVEFLSKWAMNR
jgi:hypothetical protein